MPLKSFPAALLVPVTAESIRRHVRQCLLLPHCSAIGRAHHSPSAFCQHQDNSQQEGTGTMCRRVTAAAHSVTDALTPSCPARILSQDLTRTTGAFHVLMLIRAQLISRGISRERLGSVAPGGAPAHMVHRMCWAILATIHLLLLLPSPELHSQRCVHGSAPVGEACRS